jgi:hypothetical protein
MPFIRTKENFVCQNCGEFVLGDGYTNHCPECLWSRHVDRFPGDRAANCGGMMQPIDILVTGSSKFSITHRCVSCGFERVNKAQREDRIETIIMLASLIGSQVE